MPTNQEDQYLLAEMRALKPRVERLLDAIEQQAEERGAFKAEVRAELDRLKEWRREHAEAEKQRDKEKRDSKNLWLISTIGWILAVVLALIALVKK